MPRKNLTIDKVNTRIEQLELRLKTITEEYNSINVVLHELKAITNDDKPDETDKV